MSLCSVEVVRFSSGLRGQRWFIHVGPLFLFSQLCRYHFFISVLVFRPFVVIHILLKGFHNPFRERLCSIYLNVACMCANVLNKQYFFEFHLKILIAGCLELYLLSII